MAKPNKTNQFWKDEISSWHIQNHTFILIENTGGKGGYIVRVFPDQEELDSFWLPMPMGLCETESGCAWAILNWLDDGER